MPKLDLINGQQIKGSLGEWLQAKAQGWSWTKPATGEPVAIDSVVVIGASLMNAMFGKSLSTPHATASSLLAAAGHDLPVYGYATSGIAIDRADDHYADARAAHPNAMILMHIGGNNVSDSRPYPGGSSLLNSGLSSLLSLAQGDAKLYPMSLSFRNYDGTTFQNPDAGSKPYNENLLLPWIMANFPHAMASYGRPVFDHYRRVLQDFETWLSADNVHLTPTPGYEQDREWIVSVIASVLDGVEPAEITERVYVAPEPEPDPTTYPLSIINFTSSIYGPEYQVPTNTVFGSDEPLNAAPLPNIVGVDGNPTGIAMSHAYTGNPAVGSTDPGRATNPNGRFSGLPAYNKQLLSSEILRSSAYVTASVSMQLGLSGLVPGATYEFGVVGSRELATARFTTVTIGGASVTWDTSEANPQERKITAVAAQDGTLTVDMRPQAGSTFGYLGGLSIQRIAAP